jgi:hypothetical protein
MMSELRPEPHYTADADATRQMLDIHMLTCTEWLAMRFSFSSYKRHEMHGCTQTHTLKKGTVPTGIATYTYRHRAMAPPAHCLISHHSIGSEPPPLLLCIDSFPALPCLFSVPRAVGGSGHGTARLGAWVPRPGMDMMYHVVHVRT